MSFLIEAAYGMHSNVDYRDKFGTTKTLSASDTEEDIWNGGGTYTGQPTTGAAETLELFSSDNSDAQVVKLSGLDENYNEIEENVTLTGTTPVTTTLLFWRMPRMEILSGVLNVGEITARHSTTTTNVFAVMPELSGRTAIYAFTVPNNKNALICPVLIKIGRANGADGSGHVSIRIRKQGGVYQAYKPQTITTASPLDMPFLGLKLEEKTDVKVHVETVSDNSSVFSGHMGYLLYDNGQND